MSEFQTASFRTAVGGFHKGDVTEYISKAAQDHAGEITALEEKIEALQAENDRLRAQLLDQSAAAAPAEAEEPEAPEPKEAAEDLTRQELEAYRRAEAAERVAAQRVRKLYADMQDVCDRSTRQAKASQSAAQEAMEVLDKQLEILRISAAALRDGLLSSSEELAAMTEFVPDPAEELED